MARTSQLPQTCPLLHRTSRSLVSTSGTRTAAQVSLDSCREGHCAPLRIWQANAYRRRARCVRRRGHYQEPWHNPAQIHPGGSPITCITSAKGQTQLSLPRHPGAQREQQESTLEPPGSVHHDQIPLHEIRKGSAHTVIRIDSEAKPLHTLEFRYLSQGTFILEYRNFHS